MQLMSEPLAQQEHLGKKDLQVYQFRAELSHTSSFGEIVQPKNLDEDIAVLLKTQKGLRSPRENACLAVALSALELKQDPNAANIDSNFALMLNNAQGTIHELRRHASHRCSIAGGKPVTHLSNNVQVS